MLARPPSGYLDLYREPSVVNLEKPGCIGYAIENDYFYMPDAQR
jgi:hypothetical protein